MRHPTPIGARLVALSPSWGLAALLLLAAAAAAGGPPAWVADLGYLPAEVHAIEIGDLGFPYVPVEVGDSRLSLLFDTGDMVGLSLASDTLRRLALPRVDSWQSLDSDGSVVGDFGVFRARRVTVLGRELADTTVYELAGTTLPGLIGPQFLRDARFTLDYRHRLLAFTTRPGGACDRPASVPLVRSRRHPELILVTARLAGRQVLAEVDTGKSRSTIDPDLARRLGLREDRHGVLLKPLSIGGVALRADPAKLVRLAGIDPDLPAPIEVGLGSDVLAGVVLTVSYSEGCLLLAPAR